MRYWDSSALVPLIFKESGSDKARSWFTEDPQIVTWGLTRVEIQSAIERRFREGLFKQATYKDAMNTFEKWARVWDEVIELQPVRAKAMRLLRVHPLRAADAMQLAAALVVAEDQPESMTFVCFDKNLKWAAEKEGFNVLA